MLPIPWTKRLQKWKKSLMFRQRLWVSRWTIGRFQRFDGNWKLFKKYNRKYGNHTFHSLYNTAYGLLGISMHPNGNHSPVEDCGHCFRITILLASVKQLRQNCSKCSLKSNSQNVLNLKKMVFAMANTMPRFAPVDSLLFHARNFGKSSLFFIQSNSKKQFTHWIYLVFETMIYLFLPPLDFFIL